MTGFIGIGTMGAPMALNLLRAGTPLTVWNRSPDKCQPLAEAGASIAASRAALFEDCRTVILMMATDVATDAVLERGTSRFSAFVSGHTIISMGTFTPEYSLALARDIEKAGGRFVEAPVSGSRKQAEARQLVAMLAGRAEDLPMAATLLAPMLGQSFECGAVPAALRMKLAVNIFLITMVTGLAEGFHFAGQQGLDLGLYADILAAGPMASPVSRIKADKLKLRDFERQAGISDVLKNSRLVVDEARQMQIASPLMEAALALYGETEALGLGMDDMVSVIRAIEQRTGVGK